MHILVYFVRDYVQLCITMLAVLLNLQVLGSSLAGVDSVFSSVVSPSPLPGVCHVARSTSSPLSTFFLLKKPS